MVSGALEGIELVLQSSLRPGDRVAVENPGYAALFDLLRANGLRLEPVPVDERGMRPEALEAALRARRRGGGDDPTRPEPDRSAARRRARARALGGARPLPAGAGDRGRPPRHARRGAPAQLARAPAARWAIATLGLQGARPRPAPRAAARAIPTRSPACSAASSAGPAGSATCCSRSWWSCGSSRAVQRAAGARPRALPRAPRAAAASAWTRAGSRPAAPPG